MVTVKRKLAYAAAAATPTLPRQHKGMEVEYLYGTVPHVFLEVIM